MSVEWNWDVVLSGMRDIQRRAAEARATTSLEENMTRIKDLVTGEERMAPTNPTRLVEALRPPVKVMTVDREPNTGSEMRTFEGGATRSSDAGKPDYEGYLSPLVIRRFGEYMTANRVQADGGIRASDNWQKGIPRDEYIKSAFRHFLSWWLGHRAPDQTPFVRDMIEEALCGVMFNTMGFLHELLKERQQNANSSPTKTIS